MSFSHTVEEVNSTRRKFHISVEPKVVSDAFHSAVQEVSETANIRGFRKGKVPPALLRKFYGEDIRKKALEAVINKTYQGAVNQSSLQVVSYPHIENDGKFEDGSAFKFTATVDINPMVEITGYKDLKLTKDARVIDDAAIELELKKFGRSVATFEKVTEARPITKEDVAVVTYEGTIEGKVHAPASAKEQRLDLATGRLLPEFEKAIVGMKPGESKTFPVSYPANYEQKDLAGKTAEFKLTLDGIEKVSMPAFDDVFAQRFGAKTLDEMKVSLKDILERNLENERMQSYQDQIVEQLLTKNQFEVPESLVENTVDRAIENANQENPQQKLDAAKEDVRARYRDWATTQVKGVLALGHVARTEGLSVDDKELAPELAALARSYNMDVQTLIRRAGNQVIEEVRGRVLLGKTVKHLTTINAVAVKS